MIHKWIRILFFIGMLLIPAFILLDYFTAPEELFQSFMMARLGVAVLLLIMMLIVHFTGPADYVQTYGYIFTVIVGGLISWMTVKLGGFNAGYYAGLNLVMIGVNLIIPWKPLHTMMNGLLLLGMYIGLNLYFPQDFNLTILINNLYFLGSTIFITTVISYLRYSLVKQEYEARMKADASQTAEIQELAHVAEKLSAGDFTVNLDDYHFESTAGTLLSAFKSMQQDLRRGMSAVSETAGNVDSFARQITNHTQDMAEGIQRQSTQSQQSISTIKELTDRIKSNAEEAARLYDTAESGEKRAREGTAGIEETVNGMEKVADIVSSLSTRVHSLEDSSKQIGDIIQAIVEIAEQTNMLALNASIEAARAGEQGRGFSIVAEQVGKLAERTANATRETDTIITKLQGDIHGAIEAMDNGTSQIRETMTLIKTVSKSVQEVTDYTSRLSGAVKEISETAHEQSRSSEQINQFIEDIKDITQSTSTSVEEVATAAEELQGITGKLNQLVKDYRV